MKSGLCIFFIFISCSQSVPRTQPGLQNDYIKTLPITCEAEQPENSRDVYIRVMSAPAYPKLETELMNQLQACGCRRWAPDRGRDTCKRFLPWKKGDKLTWKRYSYLPGSNVRLDVRVEPLQSGKIDFGWEVFSSNGKKEYRSGKQDFSKEVKAGDLKEIAKIISENMIILEFK